MKTKKLTKWDCLLLLIRCRMIGTTISRKEVLKAVEKSEHPHRQNLADSYRCILTKAGYISMTQKVGLYIIVRHPEKDLVLASLVKKIYPGKERDRTLNLF